jgi:tripartite-type tricarboxylate transporter receptor subunit TctC
MKRRRLLQVLTLALPVAPVLAQPVAGGKTIRIVVPLSPGTPSDAITRVVAPQLAAALGQTVIVDNQPGASGVLGVQDVMRSPPDGSTLLMGSVSPLAINMALVKNLPYDPRRDLTPVAAMYSNNHVWVVRSSLQVRSMAELIAHLKRNPGKVSAGHSTALMHIQLSALEKMAGVEMLLVPYKSTATNITDLLGGTLDIALFDMGTALAQEKNPQLRILAVGTGTRNPLAPSWPAVSETVPGYNFASWAALVGPPGMPRDVVNRINGAMAQILKDKEIAEKFAQGGGSVPMSMTPDELKAHIDAEVAKWVRLAREAKIEPQ